MTEPAKLHQTSAQIESEENEIRAAQKNSLHFEVLYNRYFEPVVRFVYQRVNTKDDAYEIAQQVFLKALLNIKGYSFRGIPFSAWLFRIAINELNMAYRKDKKICAINIDTPSLQNLITELETNGNEEKHQAIARALTQLPSDEIQLIEMRFFEKRHFKEIGEILSITENNAKVKLYRTLDKIKNFLNLK
jgi:RNA polymerase sigma-70 factor (ECF subfamily)